MPSLDLFRLSLSPQHEARMVASRFTCRLPFTRSILRATQRKENIDSHCNHKLNQNCTNLVCELNDLFCEDKPGFARPQSDNGLTLSKAVTKTSVNDKGSMSVGDPGHPTRSNVKPRSATLVPVEAKNEPGALDHDFHTANLSASVVLIQTTPSQANESFRKGHVSFCVKDKITQRSSPMRHAPELLKALDAAAERDDDLLRSNGTLQLVPEETTLPHGLVLRSDGGADRNIRNFKVAASMVCLFLKRNLDFLVVEITAANVSYVNEVEGVMPVANLALQHAGLARAPMTPANEGLFRNANCGKAVRDIIAAGKEETERKQRLVAWRESMKPVQREAETCLGNTVHNEVQCNVVPPASDGEIEAAWKHLQEHFDEALADENGQWKTAEDLCPKMIKFLEDHMDRQRCKIKLLKCIKSDCIHCQPVRMPRQLFCLLAARPALVPLPMPVDGFKADPSQPTKCRSCDESKMERSEPKHLPSCTPPTRPSKEAIALDRQRAKRAVSSNGGQTGRPPSVASKNLFHSHDIRWVVVCEVCSRRRLMCAKPEEGRDFRPNLVALQDVLTDPMCNCQCGDALLGADGEAFGAGNKLLTNFCVRRALTCGMPMEKQHCSCKHQNHPKVCCWCTVGSNFAEDSDVVGKIETGRKHLPICKACVANGMGVIPCGAASKAKESKKRKGSAHAEGNDRARMPPQRMTLTNLKPPPCASLSATQPEDVSDNTDMESEGSPGFRPAGDQNDSKPAAKPTPSRGDALTQLTPSDLSSDGAVLPLQPRRVFTPEAAPADDGGNVPGDEATVTSMPDIKGAVVVRDFSDGCGRTADLLLVRGLGVSWTDCFEVVNVPAIGNCRYHLLQLHETRVLGEVPLDITDFRRNMAAAAKRIWSKRLAFLLDQRVKGDDVSNPSDILAAVTREIFEPDNDHTTPFLKPEQQCRWFWSDLLHLCCACKKCSAVIIFDDRTPSEPRFYRYHDGNVKVHVVQSKAGDSKKWRPTKRDIHPSVNGNARNIVCGLHVNGNHCLWLQPK